MLKVILKKKAIVIIVVVLFIIVGLSIKAVSQLNYGFMKISLNYPGVEKGVNPDGTKFDMFEILSDKILDKALLKLGTTSLTIDHVRSRINIYSIVPNHINDKINTELIKSKTFAYFPNEYTVGYSQKNKFDKNETTEFLEALGESYRDVFKDKNTDKGAVLLNKKIDKSDYEYIEMIDIFNNEISTIDNYLKTKNIENGSFRSTVTNLTFENLIVELENLKNIEVSNLQSFVYTSAIAKNKRQLSERLTYEISNSEVDYEKLNSEIEICKEAMSKYDSSVIVPVFIPSLDKNNDFYLNKTNTGVDYLAKRAIEVGIKAEAIKEDMGSKKKFVDILSNENLSANEEIRLKNIAEEKIDDIQKKLDNLSKVSQETVSDYFLYKTKGYISFTIQQQTIKDFINLGYVKAAMIYGLCGFIFISFVITILNIKNSKFYNEKFVKKKAENKSIKKRGFF